MQDGEKQKSVLVLGAGVAGLGAAVALAEAGCAVTVLEAADAVGGRIRTINSHGSTVELGAEFIHGKPADLVELLDSLGLRTVERDGDMLWAGADGAVRTEDGVAVVSATGAAAAAEEDGSPAASMDVMERLTRWAAVDADSDMSFDEWAALEGLSGDALRSARGYVEGFNAADAAEVSVRSLALQQQAEDAAGGDASLHVGGGYGQLPQRLADRLHAAGGELRLRSQVVRVQWQRGNVVAILADGDEFSADAAVVALPLGVLQAGAVAFQPAPGDVLAQATRLRMGHVCRLSLVFKRRWWAELQPAADALDRMSFLLAQHGAPDHASFGVFWTQYPRLDPVLTAWVGGTATRAFHTLNDHAIAHIACADLARIFGLPHDAVLNELAAHHCHDWTHDPLSLGAYSWVPVGGVDASAKMTEPVEDTLYFAGEHTDTTGNWGTVHGAWRSGVRAAAQVLGRA